MATAQLLPSVQSSVSPKKRSVKKRRVSAPVVEKLDLELDFVKSSLPAKTRMTHPHILFLPMHYEQGYEYPLLVWLHGSGETERHVMQIMPQISLQNYVAVAPRGLLTAQHSEETTFSLCVSKILQRSKEQYDWTVSEDCLTSIEQRVFDCITLAQERCNIDSRRVFIAGWGTGGTAALRLATLFPEYFAGAATFGGTFAAIPPMDSIWQRRQRLSIFLGMDKSSAEQTCEMAETFLSIGTNVEVSEYPDANVLTSVMLKEMNRWMMSIICGER